MGDSMTSRASFSESTPTFAAVVGFVVVEVSSVGSVVEVIEVEAIASIGGDCIDRRRFFGFWPQNGEFRRISSVLTL